MTAEFLARVHVADVDLDERDAHGEDRIAQRHAGVRQGARVDEDEIGLARGRLDPVDEVRLGIALEGVELVTEAPGQRPGSLFDVGQGGPAVETRLPGARADSGWAH